MRKFILISTGIAFLLTDLFADNLDIVKGLIQDFVSGNFTIAESLFTDQMKQALPPSKMKEVWNQIENQFGQFESIEGIKISQSGEYTVFDLFSKFQKSYLDILVTVDKNSKVAGLFFRPASRFYEIPPYAITSKFEIKKIEIGNEYKVPAELTIPNGKGPFPAVILIAGSGPEDMNESIGPNRPFEDIAYGLSSNGIVVLRFDKSTYVYAKEFESGQIKTDLENEYFKDALDGIEFLKSQSYVKNVFILGHSEGGYLDPAIAKMSDKASGIILLAAPARNLEDVMIDQFDYLISITKDSTETQQMKVMISQLEEIKAHKLKDSTIVMGAPASYYYEVDSYNPIDILKTLKMPVLVMQGGKDYQVTKKDYDIFKENFGSDDNFTFKWFEDLDHIFMKWEGIPSPDQYLVSGHVSDDVIKEIVKWINSNS
ncbi:esterase EstD [Athalassotoga saccharophila]|uniref:esterase EstD n=1 Tax=Athalassotoga saccharophila TaxID=1441386 RepID=UPI00137B832C|nr:esterase EstD [Athalassotoga saccharophila]BBJ27248.1 esterase EstD [Athalassotoga saccharophila]